MTKPFIGVSGNILRDSGGAYVDLSTLYRRGWWHSSYHSIYKKSRRSP